MNKSNKMPTIPRQPTRNNGSVEEYGQRRGERIPILGTLGTGSDEFMLGREGGSGNEAVGVGEQHFQDKGAFVLHDIVQVQTDVDHNAGTKKLEHSKSRLAEFIKASQRGF
jgi:hypothetical protein